MKRIAILLLSVLTALAPLTARDDFRHRSITMDDGLPSNTVRNIVQDRHGFLWLGTDGGLCRYDGIRISHYRIADLGMNQYVSALLAMDEGLYVGTEQGVYVLHGDEAGLQRLPMDIHSAVTSLAKDKEGALWVSTQAQGVWRYAEGRARQYGFDTIGGLVSQVLVDRDNRIWAVSNAELQPLWQLNRLHDKFEPVTLDFDGGYSALCMTQTADGRLWIGAWEAGLLLMHSDGRLEQVLSPEKIRVGSHIHTLFQQADDCLCIGCDDGVVCYNPKTGEWHTGLNADAPDQRFVYAVTCDREGGIWTGTFYGGVNYLSPVSRRFTAFAGDGTTGGLRGKVISRFCEDRQGRVWVASDDGGLMCYAPKEQRMVDYPGSSVLRDCNVHALCIDRRGRLWIGTYTDGVLVMDLETGRLRRYTQGREKTTLDGTSSYAIHCDAQGTVWVASMDGLNRYDEASDEFRRIGKVDALTIDIDEDRQGHLWLSTQGGGLVRCDMATGQLKHYRHSERDATSLPGNQVNCTLADEGGQLWIGTLNGLCRYDAQHDRFERMHLDIPSQNVMGIVESGGALWLATDRGIVKYAPGEGVQRFTRQDGLVGEQAQPNAMLKTSDGLVLVGTTNGFSTFRPYMIKANSVMPPVYVTAMEILNREERTADGLPLDLSQTREVVIGYGDNRMVSFSFASLSYCSPGKNQYAYRLEGFDRDWNYVGNQTKATYTNLPAGSYTLHVKATNNDGIWSTNEARLRVTVRPPWWWTWWAKTAYIIIIGVAIWWYTRSRLRRAERRHQRELQRLSDEKEKEVREARLQFFTMIAHEIRTPVSLIIGPLEKLKRGVEELSGKELGSCGDVELSRNAGEQQNISTLLPNSLLLNSLEVIDRNAHRLLELVGQLLDFRKVEQQRLVMHFAPQNMHALIESVSERFAPTFEQGGKRFTVDYPDERFTAMVDREGVTKVVSNLLTNANKYTRDEVRLRCVVEPDGKHFRIVVSDNGVGIREDDRERIFQPFFQAEGNKPGTGIGLNIVSNIVEQHHGEIAVESEVGQGSTFTVVLPVMQEESAESIQIQRKEESGKRKENRLAAESAIQKASVEDGNLHEASGADGNLHEAAAKEADSPIPTRNGRSTMLIVDDADDMVEFLRSNFSDSYDVLTAGDGIEALDQLQKHEVQIIISDWMMPRMDGAELCRRVRSNPHTSHIPLVLLTAKTDDDSKVEGMDVGADAYIEKPFSVQYLEACIRNMLQMRRRLIEKFSSQPLEPVTEIAHNPTDNAFLQRMNALIEENFSNPDLNVNFLAERMNISRSGLFAKIKTLADITPNEMIQLVRLKRAAQLLNEGGHAVGEVGYMVGFSSPSYFTKCFQKQFGIKPGDYLKAGGGAVKGDSSTVKGDGSSAVKAVVATLFMLSLSASPASAESDRLDEAIDRLEQSLARKGDYEREKEARIATLRTKYLQTQQSHARFQLAVQLYDEYKSYKYDSAHHYALESLSQAERLGRADYVVEAKCAVAFCLLSAGLYKEAFEELAGINLAGVSDTYRKKYYWMASRLHYDMSDYNRSAPYIAEYVRQGGVYTDSLLLYLEPKSAEWLYAEAMRQMKECHYDESTLSFRQLLKAPDIDLHTKAVAISCLGWISFFEQRREEAMEYLAEAAICDNETATKETTALCSLAGLLYEDGDIERATRYVQLSLDDANFYDARQRKIEIGQILPIIEQDRYNIVKSQRNTMVLALIAAALAILILGVSIYVVRRQMRKLQQARQVIEERNRRLQQTNDQLQEANKIKNEYIGKSFYSNAEYINKVEKLYKMVDRKIAARQFDDLRSSLKESTLLAERKNMCAGFDETFLKLFPDFVEKYNQLFEEKDRRQPDDEKSLTSEMRIFALIRLGVNDSERIANFLDYSVHTVNTYKTRIKNRSIVENDQFEQRIMAI